LTWIFPVLDDDVNDDVSCVFLYRTLL